MLDQRAALQWIQRNIDNFRRQNSDVDEFGAIMEDSLEEAAADPEVMREVDGLKQNADWFRQIIKDYFAICESYYDAVKRLPPSQIEAIDMGRRGIHNEGARILRERLEGKAEVDDHTARRLFTLVCVLHFKG